MLRSHEIKMPIFSKANNIFNIHSGLIENNLNDINEFRKMNILEKEVYVSGRYMFI